jgi:predicted nucleic acid-binding protein
VTGFVVDASVAIAWLFEDEATPETEAVLDRLANEEAHAPGLWELEVANVVLFAERRGRLSEAASARIIERLRGLPIRLSPNSPRLHHALEVGRRYGLTSYDAVYLTLAQQLNLPLATLDRDLATAAGLADVELVITGSAG